MAVHASFSDFQGFPGTKLPAATSRASSEDPHEAALAARDSASELVPLGSLLEALATGESRVAAYFLSDNIYYLVLRAAAGEPSTPCCQRGVDILRRILLGEPQKVIALDLHLSDTSVAMIAARVMRAFGFDGPAKRIPIVLMMAARAELEPGGVWVPCSTVNRLDGVYRVVRVERPSPAVLEGLSECEQSIVELRLERRSNAEIARARNRSDNTVANQISTIRRKLGVPSRSGVLSLLAAHWCRSARAAEPVTA